MRYVDTARRDPNSALGAWFSTESSGISTLRIQSGFFSADSMGILAESLERLADEARLVRIIVGSNDASTSVKDIEMLRLLMRVPREAGGLGVVSFLGAYFHPKVYHINRYDGTQTAYIGSANLTKPGVQSLHIEAGLILDTRAGDAEPVLGQIADSIDWWFLDDRPGFSQIRSEADVQRLHETGILCQQRRRSGSSSSMHGSSRSDADRPRLGPLIAIPELPHLATQVSEALSGSVHEHERLSVTRDDLPGYFLIAPNLTRPTVKCEALTGSTLPGDASGLIIQLNRDSARHFFEGRGTSNVSIPVATLATLRFGVSHGLQDRLRAEFPIRFRYQTDNETIAEGRAGTNIMAYGFSDGETGHHDIRMLMPAAVKRLVQPINDLGYTLPQIGHHALLEWPTLNLPEFRITFLDPDSRVWRTTAEAFSTDMEAGESVGRGAVWLWPEQIPDWQDS